MSVIGTSNFLLLKKIALIRYWIQSCAVKSVWLYTPIIWLWQLSAELAALPLFAPLLSAEVPDVLEVGDVRHIQVPALPVVICRGGGGRYVSVEGVEGGGLGAVHVEPPVADKVLLVEQGAVGAEEAVLEQRAAAVRSADVEGLAVGVSVRIVPWTQRNRDVH